MKYYVELENEEEFLSAKELCERFKLYTEDGKLHTKFISAFLNLTLQQKTYLRKPEGLVQVFPNVEDIEQFLRKLIKNKSIEEGENVTDITIGKDRFRVVIVV